MIEWIMLLLILSAIIAVIKRPTMVQSGMNRRQQDLETFYLYEKGDVAKSVFFQKAYGIAFALTIFCIIFLASREHEVCVSNSCFPWPPALIAIAIPLIYIYRGIFGRNDGYGNKGRRESGKTSILVKTEGGSYVYRYRKDSFIGRWNAGSLVCKVCKEEFELDGNAKECYFQICSKNEKCIHERSKLVEPRQGEAFWKKKQQYEF